jgi:hypothetical protein
MHLQPLYASAERYGGEVAEDLFRRGICLPSSSSLSLDDQLYVVNQVRKAAGAGPLVELEEETVELGAVDERAPEVGGGGGGGQRRQ